MNFKWELCSQIDWDRFSSGDELRFFICKDEAQADGDRTVTIRGFYDSQGRLHITHTEIETKGTP